jgi:hypothetical protein
VVLLLLVTADRITAAHAENTIAARAERYGFIGKPAVTVEGFPFLTQLMSGRLDRVVISSGRMRLGPVVANVDAQATGIALGDKGDDVVTRLSGTGLIAFSGIDQLTRAAGIPGAAISAAGPHLLTVRVRFPFITATATASVVAEPPAGLRIQLISAPGVPSFLLQHIRALTIHLPGLPPGMTVRGVRVVRQGVIVAVSGRNIRLRG